MSDQKRNINPTAPALVAMTLWSTRYAVGMGGSMAFWDRLSPGEQQTCIRLAERIRAAPMCGSTWEKSQYSNDETYR